MNIFQHKNIIKPPVLPVFISSVIQFDKFLHPVVLYPVGLSALLYQHQKIIALILRPYIYALLFGENDISAFNLG